MSDTIPDCKGGHYMRAIEVQGKRYWFCTYCGHSKRFFGEGGK